MFQLNSTIIYIYIYIYKVCEYTLMCHLRLWIESRLTTTLLLNRSVCTKLSLSARRISIGLVEALIPAPSPTTTDAEMAAETI